MMALAARHFLVLTLVAAILERRRVDSAQFAALITPVRPSSSFRSAADESDLMLAGLEKCTENGQSHVHWSDCGSYFTCEMTNGIWQGSPKTCYPAGAKFDESLKECVDLFGYCPNESPNFPSISKCTKPDDKYVMEGDCGRYFRCHLHPDPNEYPDDKYPSLVRRYYPEVLQCPGSQKFDDFLKMCVDGECPQDLLNLPDGDGYHCATEGQFNVLPTDCSKFYKCLKCSKSPNGWCYKELSCDEGFNYDETIKACVNTPCPQDLVEKPNGPGWPCTAPAELNVHPLNCEEYYQCHQCSKPSGWCIMVLGCPEGHQFDNVLKSCIPSDICPQELIPLCPNCPCEGENRKSVHPQHCNHYYSCVACSKTEANGKCMIPGTCPTGQNFDDHSQSCVSGVCPKTLTPVIQGVHECTEQGEKNQDPQNCGSYYECHRCTNGPEGWCFIKRSCADGETFDENSETCVKTPCPQTMVALPEGAGWSCQHNGQGNVHPDDCATYYVCYECSKSAKGWCINQQHCSPGHFYNLDIHACVASTSCPQQPRAPSPSPVAPVSKPPVIISLPSTASPLLLEPVTPSSQLPVATPSHHHHKEPVTPPPPQASPRPYSVKPQLSPEHHDVLHPPHALSPPEHVVLPPHPSHAAAPIPPYPLTHQRPSRPSTLFATGRLMGRNSHPSMVSGSTWRKGELAGTPFGQRRARGYGLTGRNNYAFPRVARLPN